MTIIEPENTITVPCVRCAGTGKINPKPPTNPNSLAFSTWQQGYRPPARSCVKCNHTGKLHRVNPEWLRHTREQNGFTRKAFAAHIGLSYVYLTIIETGNANCPQHILDHYIKLI